VAATESLAIEIAKFRNEIAAKLMDRDGRLQSERDLIGWT
jgi:hypothetical protein